MKTRLLPIAVLLAGIVAGCTGSTGAKPAPGSGPEPVVGSALPSGSCHEDQGRADRKCTPGVTNPDVTPATIGSTICAKGWTATIRPPASYTNKLKAQQIAEYGYKDTNPASYEEDHLLPLEVGGHPNDPRNLWPQPHYGSPRAEDKDKLENQFKKAVCEGSMTLDAAQKQVLADWTH